MDVYTEDADIRAALAAINPTNVAVAYIGIKWADYVNSKHLKKIVVSPTLGSNPEAILELAKHIPWKHIYFLDELHSKIYIGRDSALLGSCNLSKNALGDGGKYEAAVITADPAHLTVLRKQFDEYVAQSLVDYPDHPSKLAKLEILREQTALAHKFGLDKTLGKHSAGLPEFEVLPGQRIHMSWWTTEDDDDDWVNKEAVWRAHKELRNQDLDKYYSDVMHCHRNDKVREGDWILTWKASKRTGKAVGTLGWVYVNDFIPNATGDDDYPHLAAEIDGKRPKREPFDLKKHSKLVIDLLKSDDHRFACLRTPSDLIGWTMPDPNTTVREFLGELKRQYGRKSRPKV